MIDLIGLSESFSFRSLENKEEKIDRILEKFKSLAESFKLDSIDNDDDEPQISIDLKKIIQLFDLKNYDTNLKELNGNFEK